jgi:TrmH family RNA methyltransferase
MTTAPRRGTIKEITSVSNPVIKEIRALQMKKERQETGLFLAEGLKLVTDALAAGWDVTILAVHHRVKDQKPVSEAIETALNRGALVLIVDDQVLEKISRRDNPQMVVGVIRQKMLGLADLDVAEAKVLVALEAVRDPGNLGTIIRTVDSVGASGVILLGETTDPFALEAVRATMGSLFHVPLAASPVDAFIAWAKAKGLPIFGTHLKGAVDYRTPAYPEPMVLAMGNEQAGLTETLASACTTLIKIPMLGAADSLNLAVATGIALYEARRGRI